MTRDRILNLPVGAAALVLLGTLMPWVSILGVGMGPLQNVSDGGLLVGAAAIALVLLLINRERQRTLVPAMLLLGLVGLDAGTVFVTHDVLVSVELGLYLTLIGVFVGFAGIGTQLLRPVTA